ncbi:DUF6843 domain-containing protein [Bhargavaea cecembensis]|uniref:DUF6843 domain-containing protein n=1 Tax=Bhargavaea cecembensis TaxID=394098 RepID=UPI001177413A|nr:hypothetical protein [Bhargavaea cecembensis]
MFLSMLYVFVFVVLAGAFGGFLANRLIQRFPVPKAVGYAGGVAGTFLFVYLITRLPFLENWMSFWAVAGTAELIYLFFLLLWDERSARWTSRIGMVVLSLFLAGFIFIGIVSGKKGADETYLLPDGFEGCVVVRYDVKGAPPLKFTDNEIVYTVPESGIIDTSSPMELGWASEHGSGPYRTKAFYVDENGNRVKELPQEKVRFGANGATQEEGKPERKYQYVIFGSEKTESLGCSQLESSLQ